MMADAEFRTAHTTCPLETGAQDGFPIPVAVPVDTKLPQLAQAEGVNTKEACKKQQVRNNSFHVGCS